MRILPPYVVSSVVNCCPKTIPPSRFELADGRIRTDDPLFTKQLLCQLSYVGVRPDYMEQARRLLPSASAPSRSS
jgi:hypothetical protein